MTALSELIWNAFDAEATEVRVEFVLNELEGVERIRIVDNGTGLPYDDALEAFGNLGGSWKRGQTRTGTRQRAFHGKYGKGRFRAFALGNHTKWHSVFGEEDTRSSFTIKGHGGTLGEFNISDAESAESETRGMTVEIADLWAAVGLLQGVKALEEVTATFALYLRQYPDARLIYDNVPIDASNAERQSTDYVLESLVTEDGATVEATLQVVEWDILGKRGVYLCDADGFTRHKALPRLYFRGFSYSAYLKSAHIARLDTEGLLEAADLSADLRQLLDAVRAKLREHFALREAACGQDTLARWKEQGVYPYDNEPKDDAQFNERRIFDIYSTHLNQILPDFANSTFANKQLTLKLMQELVRSDPTRVARVLDALVELPEEKQDTILALAQG